MANLRGVQISKGTIGGNTLGSGDKISGLIVNANKPSNLDFEKPRLITSVKGAIALGITSETDKTNKEQVFRHISEFYRMAGEGTPLYLMLVEKTKTIADILADSSVGLDDAPAKKLLNFAEGDIRQLAIGLNVYGNTAPTLVNELHGDVFNSIGKAQALAQWAYDNHMPMQVLLEGRNFSGNASSSADLKNLTNLLATKVSVMIGQDAEHSEKSEEQAKHFADVGTALGLISKAKINQNIGENETMNMSSGTSWLKPGLSNAVENKLQRHTLQTLEDKGYLFGMTYVGLSGVRLNNDHTCVETVIDADGNMNEHSISLGRTQDKAVRLLRTVYLPKVKTTWPLDKEGKLSVGAIKHLEGLGNTVLANMVRASEISEAVVTIDPKSDVSGKKELNVSFAIQPYGTIGFIKGTINVKTKV